MDTMKAARMMMMTALLTAGTGILPTAPAMDVLNVVTNYPNPFDSRSENTTILYTLDNDAVVKIRIYDLLGILVRDYPATKETAGIRTVLWDGTNDAGDKVAKGGYLCVVEIASAQTAVLATRKIGVVH